jgi:hypothetical protein
MYAAGTSIGMAIANGSFQVDHARVSGNSSLFEGSFIETAHAGSQIQLHTGTQMRLASETRATVYQRRLVLESGQGELSAARGFEVEAHALHISGESSDAQARIRVDNSRRVMVATLRGTVRVTNAAGLLVARIEAGNALNLEPQSEGATAPTRAGGCLVQKDGRFLLVERTTNVTLQLAGSGLGAQLGNRVEIIGKAEAMTPHMGDAPQVVSVMELKLVSKGGCAAVAKKIGATVAAAGAATAAAGAAGAGAGAATAAAGVGAATAAGIGAGTVAVIGGVAAAATIGGLAAAGEMPGQGNAAAAPSASR